MEELTEYEKQRAARLAQNQAMLESLGLVKAAQDFEQAVSKKDELAEQRLKEAEEKIKSASLAVGGIRRSSRLKGLDRSTKGFIDAGSESEDDGNGSDFAILQGAGSKSLRRNSRPLSSPNPKSEVFPEDRYDGMKIAGKENSKEDFEVSDTEPDDVEPGLSDGEEEFDKNEDDYRPDFDELSHDEEESDGEADEAPVEEAIAGAEEERGRKRSRKDRPAQSAKKAPRRKRAEEPDEEAADMDDDEINLQKALALSLNDLDSRPPTKRKQAEPGPSSASKLKRAGVGSKARAADQKASLFPDTQPIREKLAALQQQQRGALRAAERALAQQEKLLTSAFGRGSNVDVTEGRRPEVESAAENAKGPEAGEAVPGGVSEAGLEGGLRGNQAAGVAENGQKETKAGKGRKQKAKKAAALPPTLEEVDALFHIFDDRGRGQLSAADVRHVAEAHDFTWSDEQIEDMVGMFDGNHDGLLGQDDFRFLVERCRVVLT